MAEFWIGIDLGTTFIKASLVDSATFDIKKRASKKIGPGPEKETQTRTPTSSSSRENISGSNLQNPRDIWKCLLSCLVELGDGTISPGTIEGIAFCGQMHGAVLWKKGKPSN